MQSHSRKLSQKSDPSDSTPAKAGHDTYYSNQDIAVLHSVVAAAQEELDHASEPKPLPAAVLFKAYDDILPTFGIDPDSDHHLSTFVFRIGGEQGHGTLLEKFQAILGRMGIVLEFGDDTTVSAGVSPSFPPSPTSSYHSRLNLNREFQSSESDSNCGIPRNTAILSPTRDPSKTEHLHRHSLQSQHDNAVGVLVRSDATDVDPRDDLENRHRRRQAHQISIESSTRPMLEGRQNNLVAALDFWRSQVSAKCPQRGRLRPGSGPSRSALNERGLRDQHPPTVEPTSNPAGYTSSAPRVLPQGLFDVGSKGGVALQSQLLEAPTASPTIGPCKSSNYSPLLREHTPLYTPADGNVSFPSPQDRLLRCAARARQIYLASKVFNRWADRTAVRLEREAVARRHMVRFRCFQGWSHVPYLNLPTADHLKASTAVKKLQRAATYQQKRLGSAASTIADVYCARLVQQAFEHWACQAMAHISRCRFAGRTRLKVVVHWMLDAQKTSSSVREALVHCAHLRKCNTMHKWRFESEQGNADLMVARHIGADRLLSTRLGDWLDKTEIKRRSLTCRRDLLMKQTSMAFDVWNLRARTQAFRWRLEYLSVKNAFLAWLEGTAQDSYANSAAQMQYKLASRVVLFGRMKHLHKERADRAHLHGRARLFIGSMLLLKILGGTVTQRKDKMKCSIRRHLMARYTQVSSKRKKRNFFTALDRWKAVSVSALHQAQVTQDLKHASEAGRYIVTLANWRSQTAVDLRLQRGAVTHYSGRWARCWDGVTAQQWYVNAQARRLWASQRQHHCVKVWSIATLRRSGQAHTADMVLQRCGRESRSRVLQRWRLASTAIKRGTDDYDLQSVAGPPESLADRDWRSLPERHRRKKQSENLSSLVETPTRWTGLPVPITETMSSRRMTAVMETDDELDAAAASSAAEAYAWRPRDRGSLKSAVMAPKSPSTTPLAPVPSHLRRRPRALSSSLGRLGAGIPLHSAHTRPDQRQIGTHPTWPAETISRGLGRINLNSTTPSHSELHGDWIAGWQRRKARQAMESVSAPSTHRLGKFRAQAGRGPGEA